MRVTAFVLTRGRSQELRACVTSVLEDLPSAGALEVVVNGSDPASEGWLSGLRDPRLRWRVVGRENRALCRNRAFALDTDVVVFLDDDVVVPRGYFAAVCRRFREDGRLGVLGGPNLTPPLSPLLERCFGRVMASPVAAPLIWRRYRSFGGDSLSDEHELILCNLAVRLGALPPSLRFDGTLTSNEENLFLHHCRASGLRVVHSPDCFVYHRRRATFRGFVAQVRSYGRGRAEQSGKALGSLHPLFLVPSVAVLGIPWLAPLWEWWLAPYAVCALWGAAKTGGGVRERLGVFFLTPVVHLAYGAGFLSGVGAGLKSLLSVQPPIVETRQST